jgi:hypothetical protein
MRVPTRWRVVGALGFAVGASMAASSFRARYPRMLGTALGVFAAGDVAFHAHLIFLQTFAVLPSSFPGELLTEPIEQRQQARAHPYCQSGIFRTILAGRGVISGYEPLIDSYERDWATVGKPEAAYRGEFGPQPQVGQTFWSPNRIVLEGPPGAAAWINQNPGSYWRLDDRRPFSHYDVVERSKPLEVTIPTSGRAELVIDPPVHAGGLAINAIGLAGCIALLAARRIFRGRKLVDRDDTPARASN